MCYLTYYKYIAINKKTNKLIQYESKLIGPYQILSCKKIQI